MFAGKGKDPYGSDHEDDCPGVFDDEGELVEDPSEIEWLDDDGELMACEGCASEHAVIASIIEQTGDVRFYFDAIEAFEAEYFFDNFRPGPHEISPEFWELVQIVKSERKKYEAYLSYEASQPKPGGQA